MKTRILLLAALTACGDTTDTALSALNLDRPVDIAFGCFGGLRITDGGAATPDQPVVISAQPIESCTVRSGARPDQNSPLPVPPGQEDHSHDTPPGTFVPAVNWYAFILQSANGTVALATWQTLPAIASQNDTLTVNDADPLTPGKNAISVGEDPIAIVTDKVGCYVVTANAGSCDMSVLDITTALDTDPKVRVDRLAVTNGAGQPMRAKPAAMVVEPAGGVIGQVCPAQPTGLVYVAYPSCHLVAEIDTASGIIVGGIQYDAAGVPSILTNGNVTCPDECGMGALPTPGVRPVALDLTLDPRTMRRTLTIGAENSPSVTIVELDADTKPASLVPMVFGDPTGKLGFTSVAVTPQIGMGGQSGQINDTTASGGQLQFLYAVGTDKTVHVADITSASPTYRECDTQVDPRLIHDIRNVKTMSCFTVGDPTTPARRPGAKGPGIELVGDSMPTSVAIFRVDLPDYGTVTPSTAPTTLIGYYAVVNAANGHSFVVNIDDDAFPDLADLNNPLNVPLPLAIAHQLRDSISNRGLLAEGADAQMHQGLICDDNGPDPDAQGGNLAGPRAALPPTRNVPAGVIAVEKLAGLPSIRQVLCTSTIDENRPVSELGFAAPAAVRDLEFPDLRALRGDETLTLTWEGTLSQDTVDQAIDGPAIRIAQITVDGAGMKVVDQTKPFCEAGVERFDMVQLRGCDPTLGDSDCPFGYTCFVHPESQVGFGACMLSDEAERLADACKPFLTSLRRYTVGHSASGELTLLARKHVLRTTPLDGCTSSDQCKQLATYAASNLNSADPVNDKTPPDTHAWACMADSDRAPVAGTGNRCIETCTVDTDCDAGTVCQSSICMEGVEPPPACVNAPQRFELRASEAFTLIGTLSGYVHAIIADAAGNCIHDPAASPLQAARIPLVAPACDPTADPRTGLNPAGVREPNPCSIDSTPQVELEDAFSQPGLSCAPANPPTTLVTRNAPAIKLRARGVTLTMVDPFYEGDAMCNGDRLGNLGKIPLTFIGYQLAWRQTAGFSPLQLFPGQTIQPTLPVKVVRGPLQSIWVVDEGDFISTSFTTPSTRGKVFRVESVDLLNGINVLE